MPPAASVVPCPPHLFAMAQRAGVYAAGRPLRVQHAAIEAGVGAYDACNMQTNRWGRTAQEHAREEAAQHAAHAAIRTVIVGSWPSRQEGGRGQSTAHTSASAAPEEPAVLSDYEVGRMKRIAQNKEVMRSLGLM